MAAVLCGTVAADAQTDQQFSQYYEVPAYYNPAATGVGDLVRIRGGAKLQWVGIDNAPQTFTAMADMPVRITPKHRIGVGVLMQQEKLGLYDNLGINAQLSYKLRLFKGTLSIGLQAGYVSEGFKGSKVELPDDDDYHQGTDDAIPTSDIRGGTLDLGVGIWYHRANWWAGLSCTHVNSPSVKMNAESGGDSESTTRNYKFDIPRTLYLTAGCNIPIKNTLFEVIPSVMVRSDLTTYTGEVTGRVRYNKFISGGVGYRYNDAVYATVAAEFKGFFIGYAYDYPLSAISKASSGSHEIIAGYSLKLDFSEKNKNRHKSIRIL